ITRGATSDCFRVLVRESDRFFGDVDTLLRVMLAPKTEKARFLDITGALLKEIFTAAPFALEAIELGSTKSTAMNAISAFLNWSGNDGASARFTKRFSSKVPAELR
ncbi:MAG TPA: hypothetical protein VN457_02710, partial [Chlamydiales bacterium]|nr:hypothetical protein [Chlamydiales bacterium]